MRLSFLGINFCDFKLFPSITRKLCLSLIITKPLFQNVMQYFTEVINIRLSRSFFVSVIFFATKEHQSLPDRAAKFFCSRYVNHGPFKKPSDILFYFLLKRLPLWKDFRRRFPAPIIFLKMVKCTFEESQSQR